MDENAIRQWLIDCFGPIQGEMAWNQLSNMPEAVRDQLMSQDPSTLPKPEEVKSMMQAFTAGGLNTMGDMQQAVEQGPINIKLAKSLALQQANGAGSDSSVNAETGEMQTVTVMANNGRYGPYLTKTGADGKSDTRSLASEDEIFTVDLEKAKELFAQPKYGRGRGRGAAKPPLRDLGTDPETQKHVTIKDGFYGAYITDGETNRTLPKQYAPESIEPAEAFRLLAEKRAQGPSKRRGRKTAAKGAKKGAAKGAKSAKKVSATEQARADRRAKVRELADKGWANTRIAKEIGSTASTVKADVDWLTANEGYARPEVVPAR